LALNNSTTKENEIVIARYEEDVSWSYIYRDICFIYNKGPKELEYESENIVPLGNVGREAHTYLYHIINRWDYLADKTLFTQGNIADHIGPAADLRIFFDKRYDFIIKNARYIKDYDSITGQLIHWGKWLNDLETGEMRKAKQSFTDWSRNVLHIDFKGGPVRYGPGATFSVTGELIHKKPIAFYKYLLSFLEDHINPEEGHYFERTWLYIFCGPHSKIYSF
jgi:hypothetical protein